MKTQDVWPGVFVALLATIAMTPLLLAARRSPEKRAAVETEPPKPPEVFDLAKIDAYVAGQFSTKGFVGLSLAVVRDGAVVLAKGYGFASRADQVPVDVDTAFAIGSITKQFTCTGALLLTEDGKMSLDDKVAKYYPDLTSAADITLDDVGAHVSGYPDFAPLDFLDEPSTHPIRPDDLLKRFAGGKLDFPPRSRWSYSNTGYILLARAIEKAGGEPLGALLARRVFQPLGMTHTSYEPKAGAPGLARGYLSFALGGPEAAEREGEGWMGGAGAIYSSATDLAKWDIALMQGKVLRAESLARMTTSRVLENGRRTGYGCGLAIAELQNETLLVHSGEVNGFVAVNAMVPRLKAAVVMLSNDEDTELRPVYREILKLLVKDEQRVPKVDGPAPDVVAKELLAQMRRGALDRSRLGADFSAFVRDDMARGAAARLTALGEPSSVVLDSTSERGGMEVSVIYFTFAPTGGGTGGGLGATARVRALMFRSTDGKVQEFLLQKEN
jgi:CubicO group peptidase (beta-lactamase class C family)